MVQRAWERLKRWVIRNTFRPCIYKTEVAFPICNSHPARCAVVASVHSHYWSGLLTDTHSAPTLLMSRTSKTLPLPKNFLSIYSAPLAADLIETTHNDLLKSLSTETSVVVLNSPLSPTQQLHIEPVHQQATQAMSIQAFERPISQIIAVELEQPKLKETSLGLVSSSSTEQTLLKRPLRRKKVPLHRLHPSLKEALLTQMARGSQLNKTQLRLTAVYDQLWPGLYERLELSPDGKLLCYLHSTPDGSAVQQAYWVMATSPQLPEPLKQWVYEADLAMEPTAPSARPT